MVHTTVKPIKTSYMDIFIYKRWGLKLLTYSLTYLLTYLLITYLLTYSMEQSSSWEANRFSAIQEIPHILWNPYSQVPANCPYLKSISPGQSISVWTFRNKIRFYGEELSAPRPTPKLEDHPLSAVRDCLFIIFAATLHTGGRSSIRNLMTHHTVVTETHLSRVCIMWLQ